MLSIRTGYADFNLVFIAANRVTEQQRVDDSIAPPNNHLTGVGDDRKFLRALRDRCQVETIVTQRVEQLSSCRNVLLWIFLKLFLRDLIDAEIGVEDLFVIVSWLLSHADDLEVVESRDGRIDLFGIQVECFSVQFFHGPRSEPGVAAELHLVALLFEQASYPAKWIGFSLQLVVVDVHPLDLSAFQVQQVGPNPIGEFRRQVQFQRDFVRLQFARMPYVIAGLALLLVETHLGDRDCFIARFFTDDQVDQNFVVTILERDTLAG